MNSALHEQSSPASGLSSTDSVMDNGPQAPNTTPGIPLDKLQPRAQWIDCPECGKRSQTVVEGRSEGMKTFMNLMWWPLPGRKHWFEKIHWSCSNCNKQLAMQKNGKDLQVLV
ncbi:LITAF-like zinc ribbon domain-containing protein [Pochonia chlamydosporia 170]|uniref:LITAF-like zinc ribbon domain-containing protein n=1 Tax=Pochonia chlamydosporia 170 TaxID=1380566 RepID=A0A179F554_METCM|nr:LITAF-like zinc ribbon domain-containing protein [Pochonia chlamydosporia 170]OAQ60558.1 LITAF-like zinc ribbon domain-containing protein [Pochonia chlamydosporia 170]